jgi:NAD(P)-dependent dehydrogenase (short-subunit alcohol dehydrogenase family)
MTDPFRLDDEVAVVTGGTAGIGLATARVLAEAGARVVVCGRDEARGQSAEKLLSECGQAMFVRADVSSETAVAALFEQTRARFGPVTVLVNNAGPTSNR